MNILLVDDDQLDRMATIRALKKSNLNVKIDQATTVEQGLELYSKDKYDIILLDYSMPGQNGIEMVISIKKQSKDYNTAIVMMSNYEDEEVALECIKAGAQDFLSKEDISEKTLSRAILHSTTRNNLEKELHQTYQQVKKLAETDSLTGLPNRYYFDEALKQAIKNNQRSKGNIALLLFDIDNFKLINDNFGHDFGDLLLKKVVSKINKCLRGNEVFARLGGDEFSIILTNIENVHQVDTVAKRILNEMKTTFTIASIPINSTLSIGVSLYPYNGKTGEELIKYADISMYRAKKLGKNQICFFETEMQKTFHERLKVEFELREAIIKKQFQLYYQPVINPNTMELIGVEALIRWNINGDVRTPDKFINIAEETQQILDIGLWVIEEAISTLASWNKNREIPLIMAINVSAIQLIDFTIVDAIKECLHKYNIPSNLIEIELTETALFKDSIISRKVISEMHKSGYSLSLDDFGTGYSSIAHLRDHPISIIKIDKSLMPLHIKDIKQIAMIRGLVSMANILNLNIVAEGIETEQHANLCNELNIRRAQGYFYARPMPRKDLEKSDFFTL